jgi:site-specific DNA-methyltransferase (adenine-specific)
MLNMMTAINLLGKRIFQHNDICYKGNKMKYQIINGNNIDVLKTFPDNHFDSIVTDPPYGIDFLGKAWDANTGALETYQQCLRVLKPGGHILAFSAARTYHHLAITLEQAGFEIRDQIMWIYSSGFPKSQDVGKSIDRSVKKGTFIKTGKTKVSGGPKETPNGPLPRSEETIYIPETEDAKTWAGWGTALKPAHEPIALARKPIKLSIKDNVLKHGVGALNIDACRVESETLTYPANGMNRITFNQTEPNKWEGDSVTNDQGRFPSNVIGEIAEPYQKYFYCPKVSLKERHIGFNQQQEIGNNHPTVKPIELMKYLIKLVTPPGGRVLDPFNGSGSTGCAAVQLSYEYVGIELDAVYVEISNKRIKEMK